MKKNKLSDIFHMGLVVQSIVSLKCLLTDQLIKCFMTLLPNTLIFFVDKLLQFFNKKKLAYLRYFNV